MEASETALTAAAQTTPKRLNLFGRYPLVAFAPIVPLLVSGTSALTAPFVVLLYAVILFIVILLVAGDVRILGDGASKGISINMVNRHMLRS